MKKQSVLKRLTTAAITAVLTMTSLSTAAFAAPANDFPAADAKGSITITKYVDGNGSNWDETDEPQTQPEDKIPLAGVTFTIKKVGTMTQEAEDGAAEIKFDVAGLSSISVENGKHTSTELDAALKTAWGQNKETIYTLVEAGDAQITGEDGVATFSELEQGLYLVVETDGPATVTQKSVPFFVSIPSIVNAADGNTQWETDVKAYPKNAVGTPTIDKKILEDGEEKVTTNAAIGDSVDYVVPVTVIVPADGLTSLYVEDLMSKGLTYNQDVTIYKMNDADDKVTNAEKVVSADSYIVETEKTENDETKVTFKFTDDYVKALAGGSNHYYKILYSCNLNEKAVLGQTGNPNEVELKYSKDTKIETVSGPTKPKVFTYGIDLEKQGENSAKLSGVEFELTDAEGTAINITSKTAGDVAFYVKDTNSSSNVVVTDANGKIAIRGLEPGTYYLKETKTNQGYILLKDAVKIEITQADATSGAAVAKVGDKAVTMVNDTLNGDSATAQVPLTVVNTKGFDLPTTGGTGTALFTIAGIAVAVVAAALLIMRRKKVQG